MSNRLNPTPNDLRAFWMPFTANRAFKSNPRMIAGAKDNHYFTPQGRRSSTERQACGAAMPATAASRSSKLSSKQAATLDFAPTFQFGHNQAFELASRMPPGARRSRPCVLRQFRVGIVDTALKIALAYHKIRGQGGRTRLIGRERGYHGTGFGGISVGGIVNNRRIFGGLLTGVDHLPHTYNRARTGLHQGRAGLGPASGRRTGKHRHAARRRYHCCRHRRADGRVHRRAAPAQGLSQAPARDHLQAWHPADLR
jgi:beta-alanine--pyruvate transaminase